VLTIRRDGATELKNWWNGENTKSVQAMGKALGSIHLHARTDPGTSDGGLTPATKKRKRIRDKGGGKREEKKTFFVMINIH